MSSCCRLSIQLPVDALLPEDPQEENNTSITATAMEGETTSGDSMDQDGTSQERKEEGSGGGIKEGDVGSEVKHREGGDGSGEAVAAVSGGTAQAATGKGKHASGGGRKPRTKGLVKKLQEQIEFYFGDANLPKDKFLQQKIKEHPDGYVALDVIASFKKMQALTSDRSLILKAVQNSFVVELSEDKQWLRRVAPLPSLSSADVDSRTIYVENLSPHGTDHDSVRNMFKLFGNITYVSLPKHKVSGQIKGFAFIEYSTTEEAKVALEYFANKDKLPRTRKPSTTIKKGNAHEGSKGDTKSEGGAGNDAENADSAGASVAVAMEESDVAQQQQRGEKRVREEEGEREGEETERGREEEGEGEGGQPAAKRPRVAIESKESKEMEPAVVVSSGGREEQAVSLEQQPSYAVDSRSQENGESEVNMSDSSYLKSSRLESQSSETDLEGLPGEEGKGETKKKKNRQHKKKQWATILRDLNLRVISKSDWVEMKKVYCDLQKAHMKKLKSETSSHKTEVELKEEGSRKKKGFVANCLLKVACSGEGGADVKQLKEFCSRFGDVAYMDIENESKEGYIRFRESGCVETLVQSEGLPGVLFSGVEEEDERAYYLKSQAQRKQKYLKRGKNNIRGRDKLISKVLRNQEVAAAAAQTAKKSSEDVKKTSDQQEATHIRFSDSDSEDQPQLES